MGDLDQLMVKIDKAVARLKAGPKIKEDQVAWNAAMWFWLEGEWPTPEQLWQRLSDHPMFANTTITLEEARQACIAACDNGEVYGIPTVVAMRHGEAKGDWCGPLGPNESPWRIAVGEELMRAMAPHLSRAVARAS